MEKLSRLPQVEKAEIWSIQQHAKVESTGGLPWMPYSETQTILKCYKGVDTWNFAKTFKTLPKIPVALEVIVVDLIPGSDKHEVITAHASSFHTITHVLVGSQVWKFLEDKNFGSASASS
jgi:hypothetical protein